MFPSHDRWWQDSAGNTLAYVDPLGNASFSGITALGNLEVSGTLTYISSTNVTIADKQLELASDSGSPISGDTYVDQGGIVLKSTNGDKEWLWTDATDAWTSNQNIDVGSNSVIFDGVSQTIAYTGQTSEPTGTASGVAFFGGDNNLTNYSGLTFDSGNEELRVGSSYGWTINAGTEFGLDNTILTDVGNGIMAFDAGATSHVTLGS